MSDISPRLGLPNYPSLIPEILFVSESYKMSENATCPVTAWLAKAGQTGNKTLPAKMIVVGCLSSDPAGHSTRRPIVCLRFCVIRERQWATIMSTTVPTTSLISTKVSINVWLSEPGSSDHTATLNCWDKLIIWGENCHRPSFKFRRGAARNHSGPFLLDWNWMDFIKLIKKNRLWRDMTWCVHNFRPKWTHCKIHQAENK